MRIHTARTHQQCVGTGLAEPGEGGNGLATQEGRVRGTCWKPGHRDK